MYSGGNGGAALANTPGMKSSLGLWATVTSIDYLAMCPLPALIVIIPVAAPL